MKRMDETECKSTVKSMKIAYSYTVIFLFIWLVYEYIKTSSLGLPFFLFITQNLILLAGQFFLKER